jgi:hypothetical protein
MTVEHIVQCPNMIPFLELESNHPRHPRPPLALLLLALLAGHGPTVRLRRHCRWPSLVPPCALHATILQAFALTSFLGVGCPAPYRDSPVLDWRNEAVIGTDMDSRPWPQSLGHRLIRSEPYSQRSEFDGSEIVVVSLVVACTLHDSGG